MNLSVRSEKCPFRALTEVKNDRAAQKKKGKIHWDACTFSRRGGRKFNPGKFHAANYDKMIQQ